MSRTLGDIKAASDIDSLPRERKIQEKGRARARVALDADLAGMFLDNPVSHA
jgi:hypothetical protein